MRMCYLFSFSHSARVLFFYSLGWKMDRWSEDCLVLALSRKDGGIIGIWL
jgi:hypothetical protein